MPTLLLTAIPNLRSTARLCAAWRDLPDTAVLERPLPFGRLLDAAPDRATLLGWLDRFLAEFRSSLQAGESARSPTLEALRATFPASPPRPGAPPPAAGPAAALSGRFTLVVEQAGAFLAVLPELAARPGCCALLRHPRAVLGRWNDPRDPVAADRLPPAERVDPDLRRRLDDSRHRSERQLVLLAWVYERVARTLAPERIFLYEELADQAASRARSRTWAEGLGATPPPGRSAGEGDPDAAPGVDPGWLDEQVRRLEERSPTFRTWYPTSVE